MNNSQTAQSMAKTINDLIDKANNKALNRTFKRGIIGSVSGQYADVYIEGNSVTTKGIIALGNYFPVVNDKVLVLSIGETGTNLVILGPLYSTNTQPNTIVTATTITPNSASYNVTALASAATIASPGAMPNNTRITLRIKDNGTQRALTWNSIYRGVGTSLPANTVAGKVMYVGMIYNAQESRWDVVAVSQLA